MFFFTNFNFYFLYQPIIIIKNTYKILIYYFFRQKYSLKYILKNKLNHIIKHTLKLY